MRARGSPGTAASPCACSGFTILEGVFFFLFGYGVKQKSLGTGETRTCPRCRNTTVWQRMEEFKQFTLFFVPVARWKRRRLEVCGICRAAVAVDAGV